MDRFSVIFKEMEQLAGESDGGNASLVSISQQVGGEAREVAELQRMVSEIHAPKSDWEYYSGT